MAFTWDSTALAALLEARRNHLKLSWDEVARRAADEVLHVSVDDLHGLLSGGLTQLPNMVVLRAASVGLELPMEDVLATAANSLNPPRPRRG